MEIRPGVAVKLRSRHLRTVNRETFRGREDGSVSSLLHQPPCACAFDQNSSASLRSWLPFCFVEMR